LGRDHRTDFDRAVLARRAALGPGDGAVEVRCLDEEIAGELLLGVGIGAVEHFGLAVLLPHRRRRRARLQPLAAAQSGLAQRFVESAEIGPEFFLRGRGESGFVVVDQHHVAHVSLRELDGPSGPMLQ
jgi:hypothetical protein